MVRVLAVADEMSESVRSERVREMRPDVVLSAGDLPWDYLEDLVSEFAVPAAFVPGNHEPEVGSAPRGMIDLDGRVGDVGGLRVAGLGGCVHYNGGAHQYTQEEFEQRAARLLADAGRIDVLLTHAPPLGLGDEADPAHVGVAALHRVIEALRPPWHLHGHIHPYGMRKPDRQLGDTTIRNVIPWQIIDITVREEGSADGS